MTPPSNLSIRMKILTTKFEEDTGYSGAVADVIGECDGYKCRNKIKEGDSYYQGTKRVGFRVLCKKCGDEEKREEDEARLGS